MLETVRTRVQQGAAAALWCSCCASSGGSRLNPWWAEPYRWSWCLHILVCEEDQLPLAPLSHITFLSLAVWGPCSLSLPGLRGGHGLVLGSASGGWDLWQVLLQQRRVEGHVGDRDGAPAAWVLPLVLGVMDLWFCLTEKTGRNGVYFKHQPCCAPPAGITGNHGNKSQSLNLDTWTLLKKVRTFNKVFNKDWRPSSAGDPWGLWHSKNVGFYYTGFLSLLGSPTKFICSLSNAWTVMHHLT